MMNNLFSIFDPTSSVANLSLNWLSTFLGLLMMPLLFWLIPSRISSMWYTIINTLHIEFKTLIGTSGHNGSTFIFISLFSLILFNNFSRNVVMPIPKTAGADKCENYRTNSLVSHACKMLTRIVYSSMESQIEAELEEDQFGFSSNVGTREAILTLRLILEDRIKMDKPTYMTFVDLEKAFDK